tara:strand:+ start:663 stop:1124 length:462 start_codon:yes stop_codon:yes gene_type:complete
MKNNRISSLHIIYLSLLIVFFDQITKYIITTNLKEGFGITLIPGLLGFNLIKNTGAAFSLFSQSTEILALLSFAVATAIIIWLLQNQSLLISKGLAIAFLLGGTIGNGIDRVRLSYVIDFIDIIPINFPIFNLADISINIALVLIFFNSLSQK